MRRRAARQPRSQRNPTSFPPLCRRGVRRGRASPACSATATGMTSPCSMRPGRRGTAGATSGASASTTARRTTSTPTWAQRASTHRASAWPSGARRGRWGGRRSGRSRRRARPRPSCSSSADGHGADGQPAARIHSRAASNSSFIEMKNGSIDALLTMHGFFY